MTQELEDKKYVIIRDVLSEEILELAKKYYEIKFLIQKDFDVQIASITNESNDIVKPFSIKSYSDSFTESLLLMLIPKMREITGLKNLQASYSFVRFYENGQWLGKHSDRPSCQYSITLPMMAYDETPWTIYMEDSEIDLRLGDMVVYKGCEAQHWRDPYNGVYQVQAHLHYINADDPAYAPYVMDGRNSYGVKKNA